jgi:Tol biopolymer transport system component
MVYSTRIIVSSLILALLTAIVIWRDPQVREIAIVAQAPNGDQVSTGATISITFSRPVDRRSAEQSFRIDPIEPGRFFWSDQTLTFQPERPLQALTSYQVTIQPGVRDTQGRIKQREASWAFQTRGPRLLMTTTEPNGGSAVWVFDPAADAPEQIFTSTETIMAVAPSPDGRQAVLTVQREPQRGVLELLDLEEGGTRQLFDDPAASMGSAAWSPDGGFIAIERRALLDGIVGQPRIWLAQPDGTSLGPLSSADNDISYAPVWSPDGNRLALIDGVTQEVGVYDFFSDERSVIAGSSGETPSWSPDSWFLVYTAVSTTTNGLRQQIQSSNVVADIMQDLTNGASADLSPAWSPDGGWIAFTRRETQGAGSSIWVMRDDGSQPRQVTSAGRHQDILPVWSPDSQQIAFLRSSLEGTPETSVWLVDREAGEPRKVLDNASQVLWTP